MTIQYTYFRVTFENLPTTSNNQLMETLRNLSGIIFLGGATTCGEGYFVVFTKTRKPVHEERFNQIKNRLQKAVWKFNSGMMCEVKRVSEESVEHLR